ncbi:Probable sugar phosphate/phosphate translocator [Striga hermonthica]|uniref:Probable sugar phosphate/phosphate translocator n=1 Tax=Striga hermonthica TaxID=68872 RepID=A0A9N7RQP2_STRHE|nr:Probable sugar phosphate/phosphate translocator [Striga hermonthica]
MCIGATAARAFKSVLQGVLLSNDGEKLNSMNLMLYMAPIAVIVLLPAGIRKCKRSSGCCYIDTHFPKPGSFISIAGYTMTVMGVVAYGESKRRYK